MKLAFRIALKFLHRRNSCWPSFTAIASVIGVAVGVAAFLVITTVFNSTEAQLRQTLIAANPHLVIYSFPAGIPDARDYLARMTTRLGDDMERGAVFEYTEGIFGRGLRTATAVVRAIEGRKSANAPELELVIKPSGVLEALESSAVSKGAFSPVILGKGLALKLDAKIGDEVSFTSARADGSQFATRLRVVGILALGLASYDDRLALMGFSHASLLWGKSGFARGLEFRLQHPERAWTIAEKLQPSTSFLVQPWQKVHQGLFDQIERDGRSIKFIVGIITLVAAFNILTTLTMNVFDRARQIAILRSVGATRTLVLQAFVAMGVILGSVGGLLGAGLGLLVLRIFEGFELGELKAVYFLERIPVEYDWMLVIQALGLAVCLSFVSSLYPALRAVRTSPLHGIRREYL